MTATPVPASFDLASLRRAYAEGLEPRAVMEAVFDRLAAAGDPGVFIAPPSRAGVAAALEALGPRDPVAKPLWGVPFAIKDNIDLAGVPTTAACPAFAFTPDASAACVERLVAAGAIPVGKTNLDQFATGLVGTRTPHPVPRNSFDAAIVPGGSSSGSAVAVARGIVAFALGTDTAGSGRVPAGLNNLVGLKPTLGAVSTRGMLPACRTLDCVSVFALTVADAWAAVSVMAGYDARDPFSRDIRLGSAVAPGPGLTVGVPDAASRRFFGDVLAERAFAASLEDLAGIGARLVEVDLAPFFEVAGLLYGGAWVAERRAAIGPFFDARPEALHPVTRAIVAGADAFSAVDAFDGLYRLRALARACEPAWEGLDALLVPTLPRPRSLADLAADPIGPNAELGTYTNFVNLLDLCALAVPGRWRDDGFPSGVTLVGRAGADARLAGIGAALQARAGVTLGATGLPQPAPPDWPPEAPAHVELVVVGAHLSGLALNGELVGLGARLLRAVETTPDYRFYALRDGRRPGLVRVADGAGARIAAEVWALPAERFARFVDAIPAPLGVGTVRLADGTAPRGFLCEPAGLEGASDITAYGGWRRYVARSAA